MPTARTSCFIREQRTVISNSVRVPYVRTSLRGPKKMGRSPYDCFVRG
jgi:hypothetical protein